ncbi:CLC_0170 family protein [Brevibacillus sp. TJ4]|uniref:CLC_0170 family protein n=1 Tax=Brevibacillus sp. TJ4 TaxID=3234853 RepID=UPI003BA1D711
MGYSMVIGFFESLTSYFLVIVFLATGLLLRFRYYTAYRSRQMERDAAWAKGGGYVLLGLSLAVLIGHSVTS